MLGEQNLLNGLGNTKIVLILIKGYLYQKTYLKLFYLRKGQELDSIVLKQEIMPT